MAGDVLVAYATKHGATAKIAEKIGEVLRATGLGADVLPVARAGDLPAYRAVVLGSAVYVGQWRKEAAAFLKSNEKAFAGRPVWLFSSGPTGEGDALKLMKGWRLPAALEAVVDRIKPRDVVLFHGAMELTPLGPIERWIIGKVKAPLGDFRDWKAIASWADGIAAALGELG
jgi:menaquinone-dependent protoporphyrinogen oxidase